MRKIIAALRRKNQEFLRDFETPERYSYEDDAEYAERRLLQDQVRDARILFGTPAGREALYVLTAIGLIFVAVACITGLALVS